MSPSGRDFLTHILEEVEFLRLRSAGVDSQAFLIDATLRRAFTRRLEVIGEAAKRVPAEVRAQFPLVEWKAMAAMRDRLIHGYFGVDYGLVWDVVTNKIPVLDAEIRAALLTLDGQTS